jgi:hypothetical protein
MNGNFANLVPLWDVLFGTAIPAERLGTVGEREAG